MGDRGGSYCACVSQRDSEAVMGVCLERLFQESEREYREQQSQQSQQAAQIASG